MSASLLRRMLYLLAVAMPLAGSHATAAEKLKAVASFSILGDLVSQVGGERVEVKTLVGPNGDAHVYEPKPDDARSIAAADIIFVNGLGFEGWLGRLRDASGKANVITLSAGVTPNGIDPHAWQSVPNTRIYVRNIAQSLCALDAAGCPAYKANAEAYELQLQALDADIREMFAAIPQDRRIVITSHDAFGYFAREYGVTFLAPEGVSTDSEASAQDVARLIRQIREKKAVALFVESISDPRLIDQISRETGIKAGGALYSDALSDEQGPAATYIAMMRQNAILLVKAMQES